MQFRDGRLSSPVVTLLLVLCAAILVVLGALAGTATATRVGGAGKLQVKPQIACGQYQTMALESDGTLWAWGNNKYGQLGAGTFMTVVTSPTQVGTDDDWVAVACGYSHTVALKSDGSLWAWGNNWSGQLGLGDTNSHTAPARVGTDTDWVAVACGGVHTVALKSDGSLWAWGNNGRGQLGLGDTNYRTAPARVGTDADWTAVACGYEYTVALKSDGSLWAWGYNNDGQLGVGDTTQRTSPTRVGTESTWTAVACGYEHTLALKSDGSLWAWGGNRHYQLGRHDLGDYYPHPARVGAENSWTAVAGGTGHTMALKSDGSLWAWGDNYYGQLGLGHTIPQTTPTPVGTEDAWVAVACGADHTVALKSDGSLWAWGHNADGVLGVGDRTDRHSPTAVPPALTAGWSAHVPRIAGGASHSAMASATGMALTWGSDDCGQLGLDGTTDRSRPTQIGSDSTWVSVACGTDHTVGLKSDGSLWAWGDNTCGQLGQGDTTQCTSPTQVGTDTDWVTVACGADYTLALKSDGSLWAWGDNTYGQLGRGDTTQCTSPTQVGTDTDWVAVACGCYHSLALRSDGSLWTWGYNYYGQLGLSNTTDRHDPTQVGTDDTWTAVAGGYGHSLALKSDGSLWSWGANYSGQLGLGDTTDRHDPTRVGTDDSWTAVAGGYDHSLALRSDGSLWTWGWDHYGQLGLSDTTDRHDPTQVGMDNDWVGAAGGYGHSLALKSDGSLWSWGANYSSQLGLGDATVHTSPTALSPVISSLISSTHPDQAIYYSDSAPTLAWTAGVVAVVTGYSYVLDQTAGTVPDTTIDTTATSTLFTGLADGVWYFHLRACDQAADWSTTTTYTIRIDTTPPVITDNTDGLWHRSFALKLTASDADSGVAHTQYSIDGNPWQTGTSCLLRAVLHTRHRRLSGGLADGPHTIEYISTDAAGNSEAIVSCTVLLDHRPPVTRDDAPIDPQATDVTVHLTAVDNFSHVAHTYYWLGDGPWLEGSDVLVAAPVDGSGNGAYTISYYSTDNAGNVEAIHSCTVTIDVPGGG